MFKEFPKPQATRAQVLALDIAERTGHFSLNASGTWNFIEGKARNNNKQHKAFRDTLVAFIEEHGITQIIAEDVAFSRNLSDARKLSEFRGIMMEVCDTLDLHQPIFVNPSTLKKWATGNGKATKTDMINACRRRWKTNPVDDNEADATHIYMWYIRTHNIAL